MTYRNILSHGPCTRRVGKSFLVDMEHLEYLPQLFCYHLHCNDCRTCLQPCRCSLAHRRNMFPTAHPNLRFGMIKWRPNPTCGHPNLRFGYPNLRFWCENRTRWCPDHRCWCGNWILHLGAQLLVCLRDLGTHIIGVGTQIVDLSAQIVAWGTQSS